LRKHAPSAPAATKPTWDIDFSLGVGVTRTADHLITKMLLGYRFNF
jgi:hypothetical protein